jgi:hypothetical protein
MQVRTQLSVFLENRPGTLAAMCEALAQRGINLLALSCADAVDHAVVRIVPDRAQDAVHVLGEAGMLVIENDVVVADVPNVPGALGRMARRLAEAGINIEYAYCTASEAQPNGSIVLRAQEPAAVLSALSAQ